MVMIAICDDEPQMLEALSARLHKYLSERRLPCEIHCYSNSRNLLMDCHAKEQSYDIFFLDIQMDKPNGLETARRLRQKGCQGLMIFITVLKDCVFDSFEVSPFDYLVKPLAEQRFTRTMERAIRQLEQDSGKYLTIQKGNTCELIPPSHIVYCEAIDRKLYLHTKTGETIDYYDKLYRLEQQLDSRFFKCHRSYLINLDFVRGCGAGLVTLSDGSKIPVSRIHERELAQALLAQMKKRRC